MTCFELYGLWSPCRLPPKNTQKTNQQGDYTKRFKNKSARSCIAVEGTTHPLITPLLIVEPDCRREGDREDDQRRKRKMQSTGYRTKLTICTLPRMY